MSSWISLRRKKLPTIVTGLHEWELSDREKDIVRGLGNKGGVSDGKDGQTKKRNQQDRI